MNAIKNNAYSKNWRTLGEQIGKPKSVLCVSAHWLTDGTQVTANENPKTIHDFGGFPGDLYQVQYPAPGHPVLAEMVVEACKPHAVILDQEWGFDHGSWSVLRCMYPNADVAMVQLSLDYHKPASFHYELAKNLALLRNEGILIVGSGNVVHNFSRQGVYKTFKCKRHNRNCFIDHAMCIKPQHYL